MGSNEESGLLEGRFDEASQRDVLELAARLQREHFDTMSASEIEVAATEAGLNPEFVREAIRRIGNGPKLDSKVEKTAEESKQTQAGEWAVALGVPFFIAIVFLAKAMGNGDSPGPHVALAVFISIFAAVLVALAAVGVKAMTGRPVEGIRLKPKFRLSLGAAVIYALNGISAIFTLFQVGNEGGPWGILFVLCLSPFLGAVQRNPRSAYWAGVVAMCLTCCAQWLNSTVLGEHGPGAMVWVISITAASIVNGLLALAGFGVWSYFNKNDAASRDRAEMLRQLFELQSALEAHREHRVFLSVDVVGSTAMKYGVTDLEIEHTFREYQAWVGETVRLFGGEVQVAAGDGAMAMFRDAGSAVSAAKRLQETMREFNERRNRLPIPFAIRCGLSEGKVGIDGRTPLGHIQSPVIDRAAALQKLAEPGQIVVTSEMIVSAMPVLGSLRRTELTTGESAYVWP
jgi:class 3 adenylate cyclase